MLETFIFLLFMMVTLFASSQSGLRLCFSSCFSFVFLQINFIDQAAFKNDFSTGFKVSERDGG